MRGSVAVLSGIRAFKFQGPKSSQTRKENARKQRRIVASNQTLLSRTAVVLEKTPKRTVASKV